jgi:lipid-A-disaccharide synthase-like uncharacterized protein
MKSLFCWLNLDGPLLLLLYAIFYDKHRVIIFGNAGAWIPCVRNLIIHRRHKKPHTVCRKLREQLSASTNFCPKCGAKLGTTTF